MNEKSDGIKHSHLKFIERTLTTLGWAFVIYSLIQICVTLLVWIFNIKIAYVTLSDQSNIINIFKKAIYVFVFCFSGIFLWGKYNYLKYGKLDRRNFPKDVSNLDLSKQFDISESQIEEMQNQKVTVFDKNIL